MGIYDRQLPVTVFRDGGFSWMEEVIPSHIIEMIGDLLSLEDWDEEDFDWDDLDEINDIDYEE